MPIALGVAPTQKRTPPENAAGVPNPYQIAPKIPIIRGEAARQKGTLIAASPATFRAHPAAPRGTSVQSGMPGGSELTTEKPRCARQQAGERLASCSGSSEGKLITHDSQCSDRG